MRKHKGFTLIELVVVVMILGILAAVAAPKLLGTSSTASDNGLKETLGVVRDAIERYAAEHGGALPGLAGTEAGSRPTWLPYLRVFPKCPVARHQQQRGKLLPRLARLTADAVREVVAVQQRRRHVHLQLDRVNQERSDGNDHLRHAVIGRGCYRTT